MTQTQLPDLEADDVAYVTRHFQPLELLAPAHGWTVDGLHAAMRESRAPQPTYWLPDGTEMVPADYFTLMGDGANLDTLRERFVGRYEAARARLGLAVSEPDSVATWDSYLTGQFGACLKSVTPEAMALKDLLVGAIEKLVATPQPDDADWRRSLRDAVTRLDALEMPFASWDDIRFGRRSSRARSIDDVRARFPEVFAPET